MEAVISTNNGRLRVGLRKLHHDWTLVTVLSLLGTALTFCLVLIFAEPVWQEFGPPFEIPRTNPRYLAPVDGPFYIQNALRGYDWQGANFLSLWFHPLLSTLVSLVPLPVSLEVRFWLLSLAFSVGCLILTYKLLVHILPSKYTNPQLLLFIWILPGALGIATGNPEIPTLFFSLCLLLSVLVWDRLWGALGFGFLAILTKPNALYMVPVLLVYLVWSVRVGQQCVCRNSCAGIVGILFGWFSWIIVVGINTGDLSNYWRLRELTREYVAGDVVSYVRQIADSFIYTTDARDQLRYLVAVLVPTISLWFLLPLNQIPEVHRIAIAAGYVAVLVVALYMGNPNKIIVYVTTLPGHFISGLSLLSVLTTPRYAPRQKLLIQAISLSLFMTYCTAMSVFYILGTALAWYY
jgi:hypothetical protein